MPTVNRIRDRALYDTPASGLRDEIVYQEFSSHKKAHKTLFHKATLSSRRMNCSSSIVLAIRKSIEQKGRKKSFRVVSIPSRIPFFPWQPKESDCNWAHFVLRGRIIVTPGIYHPSPVSIRLPLLLFAEKTQALGIVQSYAKAFPSRERTLALYQTSREAGL